MKYRFLILIMISGCLLTGTGLKGQSIDQRLTAFTQDYARGYVQPFADVFGANLNSGLYQGANGSGGLDVYAGFKLMGAMVPSGKLNFLIASPYNGVTSSTATIFGGNGSTIPGYDQHPGAPQKYLDGASNLQSVKLVPLIIPQVSLGNFAGTQLMFRFIPARDLSQIGKLSMFGFGVQHSISQYIPLFPVRLSAQVAYQSISVGDNFSAKAYSVGVQASKNLIILTLYGGIAVEKSDFSLTYVYNSPIGIHPASYQGEKYSIDLTGSNRFRATIGIVVHLLLFDVNADYNAGDISVISAGIGITF